MARRGQSSSQEPLDDSVVDLRHPEATRKNVPPAGIEARGKVVRRQRAQYAYNPYLPPVLRFDADGKADALPELIEQSGKRPLTAEEQRILAAALRNYEPWLWWNDNKDSRSNYQIVGAAFRKVLGDEMVRPDV
jgi:hypothetical protein